MSEPEKIRKNLELLAGILPNHTLNVTGQKVTVVSRSGIISSSKRYLYGENRKKTVETIEKIVDDAIRLLCREIFILQLLKRAHDGIDNLRKTYMEDKDIVSRLNQCLEKIRTVCLEFQNGFLNDPEQIPRILEKLTATDLSRKETEIIQSQGQTPENNTPSFNTSTCNTPSMTSMITTPPSSPRGDISDLIRICQATSLENSVDDNIPLQSILMNNQGNIVNNKENLEDSIMEHPEMILPSILIPDILKVDNIIRRARKFGPVSSGKYQRRNILTGKIESKPSYLDIPID
jgi:hypothetical protein